MFTPEKMEVNTVSLQPGADGPNRNSSSTRSDSSSNWSWTPWQSPTGEKNLASFTEGLSRVVGIPGEYDFSQVLNFASLEDSCPGGFMRYTLSTPSSPGSYSCAETELVIPKPRLNIIPDKLINFANYCIRFSIQALNLPSDIPLNNCWVQGSVETPSGRFIQCQIREAWDGADYRGAFNGMFKSTEEVGLHTIRVRMVLPMGFWAVEKHGVLGEETLMLISRNYYRQSLSEEARTLQLTYVPWRPANISPNKEDAIYSPSKVWGISCDKFTNRLFFADRNDNTVTCVDAEGREIFKVSGPNPEQEFRRPTGVACDEAHRRVIIADKDNHRICFYSMDGQFISTVGGSGYANGSYNYPWDLAINPAGDRIVVCDSRNKRLQLLDGEGNYLNKFSIYEHSPFEYKNIFDYPRGVTFNKSGSMIYVTDFNVHNILQLPVDFTWSKKVLELDGNLRRPQGIASDASDGLLVCDSKNRAVRHIYPEDGQTLSKIFAVGDQKVGYPVNVTVMGDGKLAILDAYAKLHIF